MHPASHEYQDNEFSHLSLEQIMEIMRITGDQQLVYHDDRFSVISRRENGVRRVRKLAPKIQSGVARKEEDNGN